MSKDNIIPWYLRVLGVPFLAIGAVADAVRKLKPRK